ncbi:Bcr/CflA family multidrug efflux MFS transporter [Roseomonas elaeocarpi]|uniref:Bcr/CflA family efflux transporter n=1 Tax=Roseomonas elaeocarpi TaxID=907779 RepID=A0ABV6JQY0_9PROT
MTSATEPKALPIQQPAPGVKLVVVLSALMALGSVATDMYLPAMPALATIFGVPAARVQLTLSSFLVGFSTGQLAWGPLGDRYGRKSMVAVGILFYLAGSAGCALSDTAAEMMVWRFVQAVGACAGPVLARAMVRDLYGRDRAASMLSVLLLVMGIAPLVAPLLGGQVLVSWSWRGIFWIQALFGVLALGGVATLRETLLPEYRISLRLGGMLFSYLQLVLDRRFLGYGLSGGFFYAGVLAYVAGTPFAYIDYYGVPAQLYGLLFGMNIAGMMTANMVNSRLVLRLGTDRLFRIGTGISAAAGVVLMIDGYTGFGGLWGLVVPIFFYVAMLGLVVANSIAGALSAFPHKAGTASALVGAVQFALAALSSAAIGWVSDGTPWAMALIVGASGVLALLANVALVRGTPPQA